MLRHMTTATVAGALLCASGLAQSAVPLDQATLKGDEVIETPAGEIELQDSYFDEQASQRLFDTMDVQRAAQAYIWSTPLVSTTTWRDNQGEAFGTDEPGAFAVLETLKEKRGIVTANLTTPYIFNFTDLSDGPVQIDYPPGQTAGGVLDMWMRPVFDLGLTGPDKGEGATYIVVGPGDDPDDYSEEDAHVFQSETNNVLVGIRILDPDPAYYDTYVSQYQMGPVGDTSPSTFVKGKDVEWSATAPRGLAYWEKLASIIDEEPVREIDKAWMAMLAPLGIVKGEAFAPDERQREILLQGAALGELMTRNLQVNPRYADVWWEGTSWYKSFDFVVAQATDTLQQIDERATWFYEAVGSSEGMVNPTPGAGQVYMTTKRDANGDMLRADRNYVLHVPAEVPVEQFWSLTLYSEDTRRPYDNGGTEISDVSLDSRMEQLQYNEDGSIDLYIGPDAPSGLESNHMKTVEDDGWFVYFRLYAPGQAFFDKSFSLPDFELVE
ncbi:MAG: DUF1254 domain-containing protein [Gammaproteobacteria bacterium]|uniref:DUF1254 domain-containing protein n=1 Tax=Halomonas sp. EF61 TaxID=2950869 RepID=UPI0032DF5623|nr:DUF1254 domain-containing protein [Gammaproteobacteria bacterium]